MHGHPQPMLPGAAAAAEVSLAAWRPVLAERPDAILHPTAGLGATIEERYRHHELLARAGAIGCGGSSIRAR